NAFRIPVDILEANNSLTEAVSDYIWDGPDTGPITVLSPDAGGVKRAKKFQASLAKRLGCEVSFAHAHKTRSPDQGVEIQEIIGPIENRPVIAVDDMIGTGGTLKQIEQAVRDGGGKL